MIKRYSLIACADGGKALADAPNGNWVKYEEVADLQRQLAAAKHTLQNTEACLHARNQVLNAAELRLADAIRERDQYKAACEMATALRPLGAVQVIDGGAAVLLDTSKGAT